MKVSSIPHYVLLLYWVIAVMGAFIAALEIVFLGPVHSFSHVFPGGQGLAGDKAAQGYTLVLSAFLRMPLLVLGFFAFLSLTTIGGLITFTLFDFVASATLQLSNWMAHIFVNLGLIAALFMILNSVIERSTALFVEIPDRSIKFLGHGQESLGSPTSTNAASNVYALLSSSTHSLSKMGGGASTNPQKEQQQNVSSGTSNKQLS